MFTEVQVSHFVSMEDFDFVDRVFTLQLPRELFVRERYNDCEVTYICA